MDVDNKSRDIFLDVFLYEVDKSINTGNVIYIKNAIKNYVDFIDKRYIDWANLIIQEIIEEKMKAIAISELSI